MIKEVEDQTASNGNNLRKRNNVGVITGTTAQSQSAGAGGQGRVSTGSDSVNARKNDSILAKHEALAKSKLKAPVLEFKDGIKDVPDEIKKKIRSKSPLEYKLVYLLTFSDIILSLCALCVPGYKVAFLRSHWIHYVIIYTMLYFKYRKLKYEYFLLDYCYF